MDRCGRIRENTMHRESDALKYAIFRIEGGKTSDIIEIGDMIEMRKKYEKEPGIIFFPIWSDVKNGN